MYQESPGSIRYQLGMSVGAIRDATRLGETGVKADLYQNIVTICAPYIDDPQTEDKLRTLPPGSGKYVDHDADRRLNQAIEQNLSTLLRLMAKRGLYAYLPGETGDATHLRLKSPDPDEDDQDEELEQTPA